MCHEVQVCSFTYHLARTCCDLRWSREITGLRLGKRVANRQTWCKVRGHNTLQKHTISGTKKQPVFPDDS